MYYVAFMQVFNTLGNIQCLSYHYEAGLACIHHLPIMVDLHQGTCVKIGQYCRIPSKAKPGITETGDHRSSMSHTEVKYLDGGADSRRSIRGKKPKRHQHHRMLENENFTYRGMTSAAES